VSSLSNELLARGVGEQVLLYLSGSKDAGPKEQRHAKEDDDSESK
jgi:hypothetical protein